VSEPNWRTSADPRNAIAIGRHVNVACVAADASRQRNADPIPIRPKEVDMGRISHLARFGTLAVLFALAALVAVVAPAAVSTAGPVDLDVTNGDGSCTC
jgi:hypothetical protein